MSETRWKRAGNARRIDDVLGVLLIVMKWDVLETRWKRAGKERKNDDVLGVFLISGSETCRKQGGNKPETSEKMTMYWAFC